MNEMMLSLNAEADKTQLSACDELRAKSSSPGPSIDDLPAHSFPGGYGERPQIDGEKDAEKVAEPSPDESSNAEASVDEHIRYDWRREKRRRAAYRGRTIKMLRQYLRYSMETGRLPSLLGREFFRSKVPRHTAITFEDRVIFVVDMETCLHKLDEFSQKVIGRIVLQEYDQEEAARLLGCARMTVHRTLLDALDRLGSILLRLGLMERLHWPSEKSCQGGNSDTFSVSDCKYGE